MKKLMFSLIFLGSALTAFCQQDSYMQAMETNLSLMDSAASMQDLQTMANNFNRIAGAEPGQWLPHYYSALCEDRIAFLLAASNPGGIDAWADKAHADARAADSLHPSSSEVQVLFAMIASARIMVDPQSRGQEYGMMSASYVTKALNLNPDNPRAYLLEGENAFHTPAQWGGGKKKAKPLLEESLKKFASVHPKSEIDPHWGLNLAKSLLSQCN